MPAVLPFAALRYDPDRVGDLSRVLCPPYDVITPERQADYQALSPFNAVHLELPADLPGQPNSRYAHAAELLAGWHASGALRQDQRSSYYLHRTTFDAESATHRRRDLIASLGVEPWSSGAILPHEHTLPGAKADRLALLQSTHANLSPIWVLYRSEPPALTEAWRQAASSAPTIRANFGDEFHEIWRLDDESRLAAIREGFQVGGPLYIADGHHRYETALTFSGEAAGSIRGAGAMLAVITSANDPGLRVLPTHRVVHALGVGLDAESLQRTWSTWFDMEWLPLEPASADVQHLVNSLATAGQSAPAFVAVLGDEPDRVLLLRLRDRGRASQALPADHSAAWKALDVAILHGLVLEPLLSAAPAPRLENLSYQRDPLEAIGAVRTGQAQVAFLLNATRVHQVLDVADAQDRMPEKSTYFYPKPPTGMVIRDLDSA